MKARSISVVVLFLIGYSSTLAVSAAAAGCLQPVAEFSTTGVNDVVVAGTTAFLVAHEGISIVDVSDPLAPVLLSSISVTTPFRGQTLQVADNLAYIATGDDGVMIVDVSDPSRPSIIGQANTPDFVSDIAVFGTTVYVTGSSCGPRIIDVSDPSLPVVLEDPEVGTDPAELLRLANGYLLMDSGGEIHVLDITDPHQPVRVARGPGGANDIEVAGDTIYMAWGDSYAHKGGFGGLKIIDFSDPLNPTLIGVYATALRANGVTVRGDRVYLADQNGLHVIDASNPSNPVQVAFYDTGFTSWDAALVDDTIYVATSTVKILDISTCSSASPPLWIEVAAHINGKSGSIWRTDLVTRNRSAEEAQIELVLRTTTDVVTLNTVVPATSQGVFEDVVGLLNIEGKGMLEIKSDQPLEARARVYNQAPEGTFGQHFEARRPEDGLFMGETAWLTGLRQRQGEYRTNLSVANMGDETANALVTLYATDGTELVRYFLGIQPGTVVQDLEPFVREADAPNLGWGFAKVTISWGGPAFASASVIDSRTNDATTIPMSRFDP